MTYRIVPCPKCNRLHGVVAVRASKRGPAQPYDGPFVSPLRQAQRSGRPDLAAALGSVARSRDEGAQSGVPERAPGPAVVTPVAANPMSVRSRQRRTPPLSGAGG